MSEWTGYDAVRLDQDLRARRLAVEYEQPQRVASLTRNVGGIAQLRRVVAAGIIALAVCINPTTPVHQPDGAVHAGA